MAKDKKISFSSAELTIKEIEEYYIVSEKALRLFYNNTNIYFIGYTTAELKNELNSRIEELNKNTALTLLSAIEAHFRIDYLQRVYTRDKENISKRFRELYGNKKNKAALADDILEIWKEQVANKKVIEDIRSALNYRNWLAHGRYWVVKLGRNYDFSTVLNLAIYAQKETRIDMGA